MTSQRDFFAEALKLYRAKRYSEAEALFRTATEAEPNHFGAWHNLGLAYAVQEKLAEAACAFQRALDLSPQNVDTITQLGLISARQNKLPEAITTLRRAIELQPDHAHAVNNLGVVLSQLGRLDEGLACYRDAARLQPDYAEAHFNLGVALGDRQQNAEAIACYERALRARPDHAGALINIGLLLVKERRPAQAVVYFEHAIRLQPKSPSAHSNLSIALADIGRFDEAIACCDEALRLNPLDPTANSNRGNALMFAGRIEESLACYALALVLNPKYVGAHWNRALAWLTIGDFARGWLEYEWRWQRAETKSRNFPEPAWDGGPLDGKTILLWCEQGLGDALQFVRFASLLKKRGATVWLDCLPKMIPILSSCPGIDRALPEGSPLPSGFDCQLPIMSLPLFCATSSADIPSDVPYLSADPALTEHWRKELGSSRAFKIGVAWQGNPGNAFDQHRSFPVHWFRALAALDGVELYSLQKEPGAEQLASVRFPIIDLGTRLDQSGGAFMETAAVMNALDLVITCDSALGHLAGALGRPVWLPLAQVTDWRWLLDREDSLWYPTMRLFRQPKLGDWASVFERMRSELQRLLDARSSILRVEVAPGELLDKLTILQIKSERIADAGKLRNVRAELVALEATRRQRIRAMPGLDDLLAALKDVNERLWDTENRIRVCEKTQDFTNGFIDLARSVYQTNDRRAAIKKAINELLGASFREEKEYHGS